MPDIDYTTCTMDDVVARSLAMHPSWLANAMRDVAMIHTQAAQTMIDGEACRVGVRMAADARTCAILIDRGTLTTAEGVAKLSFGRRIMLFTAAAKLNCLPPGLAMSIARRADICNAE